MGKNNTPFNKEIFSIKAIDTSNVTSVTNKFGFFFFVIRYNNLTSGLFKVSSLPDNFKTYNIANGGIMKMFDVSNKDDLDRYFVPDTTNPIYISLYELFSSNIIGNLGMKVVLADIEDEVLSTDIPTSTNILKYIHKADVESLPYKKITKLKDQLHTYGYMIKGLSMLGIGEELDAEVSSLLTPDLLSLALLNKTNAPIKSVDLASIDKSLILKSDILIDYNKQDDKELIFELLSNGESIKKEDLGDDETKIEDSSIIVTYKKSNNVSIEVVLTERNIDGSTEENKCLIKGETPNLIDFNSSRIISIKFSDGTIASKYSLTVISSPTSKEYIEKFKVKRVFDSEEVKIIVSNSKDTLLTLEDFIINISFNENVKLNSLFNLKLEEKEVTPVSASVLKYLYVKLAEIKISKSFGSSVEECSTIIDVAPSAIAGGNVFSYKAFISSNVYDMLEAEAEGAPITLVRDYFSDTFADKVVNLIEQETISFSLSALGKFYSINASGTPNYSYDVFSHDLSFSESFIEKLNLPREDSIDVKLPIAKLTQLVPVVTNGTLYYYCTNGVSLVATNGIYNGTKDLFIKAFAFYEVNIKITAVLVRFKSTAYSLTMVNTINDALLRAVSTITTVFDSGINLTIVPLKYTAQQPNLYIITTIKDGVRITNFNFGEVAKLIISGLIDVYSLIFNREIQG